MKKILGLVLVLAFAASYAQAQAVATTVTNRGEVITVYVAGDGITNNVANLDQSVPQGFAVGGNLAVEGTTALKGVATLTAAPTLVSTNTPGAITLTMTTAPTAANAGKAAPIYLNVKVGAVNYVIPAWPLTP